MTNRFWNARLSPQDRALVAVQNLAWPVFIAALLLDSSLLYAASALIVAVIAPTVAYAKTPRP